MSARVKVLRDPRKALLVTIGGAIVVLGLIAALVLARGGLPAFGQSFTIGFVDMQRALDAHPRKVASERALQEFFQAKQREFTQRSKGITAEQRQLLDRELQQQVVEKRQQLLGGAGRGYPHRRRAGGAGGGDQYRPGAGRGAVRRGRSHRTGDQADKW